MKNLNIKVKVITFGLILSFSAMAESMSKDEYKFLEKNIDTEYGAAIVRCHALSEKASVRCIDIARSNRSISKTELQHSYKPVTKTKIDTSKAENTQKTRPSDPNGVAMGEELTEDYMDSAVTEVKPFKANVNPMVKDSFRNHNKPIAM